MEYEFYAEQKYLHNEGIVEARILTADEAGALGYEDDYKRGGDGYTLYVDGFDTRKGAQNHLESLTACRIMQ